MVDIKTFGKTPLKFNLNSDWSSGIFTSNAFSEGGASITDRIVNFVNTGASTYVVNSKYQPYQDKYADILSKEFNTNDAYNKETVAALTALRGIASLATSGKIYDYYKLQERSSIDAAKATAKSIQMKGEIELRNLQYVHEQKTGKDIAKIAGKRGNLSGSNLDVVMFEKKQQLLDQTTVQNNYEMQEANIIRNGYLNSANLALQASAKAGTDKLRLVGALLQGVDKYYALGAKEQVTQMNRDVQQRTRVDSMIHDYERFKEKAGSMFKDPAQTQYGLNINSPDVQIGSSLNESGTPFANSLLDSQKYQNSNSVVNYISF